MSLINILTYRKLEDLSNDGYRLALTGLIAGAVTDSIIVTPDVQVRDINTPTGSLVTLPAAEKYLMITGYRLSTDSVAPVEVSLGFKKGVDATNTFFQGFIGGAAGSVERCLPLGDWKFGDLEHLLVITAGAINVSYTIDARVSYSKVPKNFIQQLGNLEHDSLAHFPPESSLNRGSVGGL
jgi:hypothetical protein